MRFTTGVPMAQSRFLGIYRVVCSLRLTSSVGPHEGESAALRLQALGLLEIDHCRPQLTIFHPQKAQKTQKERRFEFDPQTSCNMCLCFVLGSVLHAGFGVFLEKVADVDREAFEFFVESLT